MTITTASTGAGQEASMTQPVMYYVWRTPSRLGNKLRDKDAEMDYDDVPLTFFQDELKIQKRYNRDVARERLKLRNTR